MPALGSSDHVRSKATIDRLPDLQRKAVIDAILRGDPLRSIAAMAGVSFARVRDYRDKHVMPNLRLTPQIDYLAEESTTCKSGQNEPIQPNVQVLSNQQTARALQTDTKAILRASPVRQRAESLWRYTARNLRRAEAASKTEKPDFSAIAPLLNQAHKNLEIQGKLSGELATAGSGGAPSVTIQIVMPTAEGPSTVDIDVMGAQIGLKSGQR
jgi:hypothetical protein